MKNIGFSIILFSLLSASLWAQGGDAQFDKAITVEGTELAQHQSALDVLRVLPGLTVDDEGVRVIGRGTPLIYIGNRRVTAISELNNITADRLKDVQILKHPGAEYEKGVVAVIVIRLRDDEKEGFSLNNNLQFDLTSKLSTSDRLALGWRHKALTLNGYLSFAENRMELTSQSFSRMYKDHILISENETFIHPDIKMQWLHAGLSAAYDFNRDNRLTLNYSLARKQIDNLNIPEIPQTDQHPATHHSLALEYTRHAGRWDFTLGNNTVFFNADYTTRSPYWDKTYQRRQYDVRTYAKAKTDLWKGTLNLGAEYQMDDMDAKLYDENPAIDALLLAYDYSHAKHPDRTVALFASIGQTFGRWSIEAGLRYEYYHTAYTPCADDGLLKYLANTSPDVAAQIRERYPELSPLLSEGRLIYKKGMFFPSLKVSTKLGETSTLSLAHTEYTIPPDFAITRLRISEIDSWYKKVMWSEIASATTLDFTHKWLDVAVTFTHYDDPICETISAMDKYNAPDYDALDLDVTLTPQVGIWTPMFHANLHKQWFDMPLASGKDRLTKPYAILTFNNTLALPHDWLIRCNATWHSKGAQRNIYYVKPDLCVDASIQKTLPRAGLTFLLSCYNVLNNSYNDFSRYVQAYYGISEGSRDRVNRTLTFSIQYKL